MQVDTDSFNDAHLPPGYALVDTGCQHPIIGKSALEEIIIKLMDNGLKPMTMESLQLTQTHGVGGSTDFIDSVRLPVALEGVCGVLDVQVVDQNIPFLSPIE